MVELRFFSTKKIFLYHNWGQATSIAILLTFSLLLVGLLFRRQNLVSSISQASWGHRLASPLGLFILLAPLGLLFFGLLRSLFNIEQNFPLSMQKILQLTQGSIVLGIGTGLVVFFLGSLFVYCFFSPRISHWIFFFTPPGWMVVAFSFFLMTGESQAMGLVKSILAMTVVFTPFLYRFILHNKIESLRDQVEVAQIIGRPWNKIFFHILWPQTLSHLAFLAGIAAVWASGDFALTGVLLSDGQSLALQIKNFLLNYRLTAAFYLLPILCMVIIVVFSVFQGLVYVCREKNY